MDAEVLDGIDARIAELETQVRVVLSTAQQYVTSKDRIEGQLRAAEAEMAALRAGAAEAEAQRDALEWELLDVRTAPGEPSRAFEDELAALRRERDELRAELRRATELSGALEEARTRAEEEARELRERFLRDATSSETRVRERKAPDDALRRRAWKRLVLDDDAIRCFGDPQQFPKPRALLHALVALDNNDVPVKPWDAQGVVEVDRDIATGLPGASAGIGRIYYREYPASDRLHVWVDIKRDGKQQGRFVERIANRPLDDAGA